MTGRQAAWRVAYLAVAILLLVAVVAAYTVVWWLAVLPALMLLGWVTPGFNAMYMRARHSHRA